MAALALLGLLLAEVWQNARVAELCLRLEKSRRSLASEQAREGYLRAQLERKVTRAALSPVAGSLGLAPAEAGQVVMLPAEYLAHDGSEVSEHPALVWAERFSRALVPEATARDRSGSTP